MTHIERQLFGEQVEKQIKETESDFNFKANLKRVTGATFGQWHYHWRCKFRKPEDNIAWLEFFHRRINFIKKIAA